MSLWIGKLRDGFVKRFCLCFCYVDFERVIFVDVFISGVKCLEVGGIGSFHGCVIDISRNVTWKQLGEKLM